MCHHALDPSVTLALGCRHNTTRLVAFDSLPLSKCCVVVVVGMRNRITDNLAVNSSVAPGFLLPYSGV